MTYFDSFIESIKFYSSKLFYLAIKLIIAVKGWHLLNPIL